MYPSYMMSVSHNSKDISSCKIDKAAQYHVPDEPSLPFQQIISLQQKYTHNVFDVHRLLRFLGMFEFILNSILLFSIC